MRLCCGAADNSIGDAGALAVSKALESGNCKLTSLDVGCESGMAVRCVCCCPWVCLWLDGAWAAVGACLLWCGAEKVRAAAKRG